jgi:DNA-binding LacI/PurR family transcriptional regulator
MALGNLTIKDVAKAAGVSHITVSRVFSGDKKKYPVSAKTRRKVLNIAQKLNYQPNAIARAMRTQRTGILSLYYQHEKAHYFSSDDFYLGVQGGVESALAESGRSLLISAVNSKDNKFPVAIFQGLAEAVLAFEVTDESFFKTVLERNLPLVSINNRVPIDAVDCISEDNTWASMFMVEQLLKWGHKNIALVTTQRQNYVTSCRNDAFIAAIHKHEIPFSDKLLIKSDAWLYEADQKAVDLKRKHPEVTAFMCTTDGLAKAVILGLREAGLRVPEDVSVIGCGGQHHWLQQELGLTTIHFSAEKLGRRAANMAIERINGDSEGGRIELLAGKLIPGVTAGKCCLK